jgi:hypothetical protein
MKINFKIFQEYDRCPHDILGEISLTDKNSTIRETNAYIDSWICSLVQGLIILKNGYNNSIDLVAESKPIEFKSIKNRIIISYRDSSIEVDDLSIFENVLIKVCNSFLMKISDSSNLPSIKFLNDFINNKIDPSMPPIQPVIKKWKIKNT